MPTEITCNKSPFSREVHLLTALDVKGDGCRVECGAELEWAVERAGDSHHILMHNSGVTVKLMIRWMFAQSLSGAPGAPGAPGTPSQVWTSVGNDEVLSSATATYSTCPSDVISTERSRRLADSMSARVLANAHRLQAAFPPGSDMVWRTQSLGV